MKWKSNLQGWAARKFSAWGKALAHSSKDVTIVMQGPANWVGYANIPNYLKVARVVVSCYEGEAHYLEEYFPDVKVIRSPPPAILAHNRHNLFKQAYTSFNGLKEVDTPFVVKARSDESYGGMAHFIEILRQNPDKLTTNNIFFNRADVEPFCPSDHLMGGKTEKLKIGFAELMKACKDRGSNEQPFDGRDMGLGWLRRELANETVLFLCYLRANGVGLGHLGERRDTNLVRRIMKDNLQVVPMEKLAPYVWSQGSKKGRFYYTDFTHENPVCSMEEI